MFLVDQSPLPFHVIILNIFLGEGFNIFSSAKIWKRAFWPPRPPSWSQVSFSRVMRIQKRVSLEIPPSCTVSRMLPRKVYRILPYIYILLKIWFNYIVQPVPDSSSRMKSIVPVRSRHGGIGNGGGNLSCIRTDYWGLGSGTLLFTQRDTQTELILEGPDLI